MKFLFSLTSSPPLDDPRPSKAYFFIKEGRLEDGLHMIEAGQWKGWDEGDFSQCLLDAIKNHSSYIEPFQIKNFPALPIDKTESFPELFSKAPLWAKVVSHMIQNLNIDKLKNLFIPKLVLSQQSYPLIEQLQRKDPSFQHMWFLSIGKEAKGWDVVQFENNNLDNINWAMKHGFSFKNHHWKAANSLMAMDLLQSHLGSPDFSTIQYLIKKLNIVTNNLGVIPDWSDKIYSFLENNNISFKEKEICEKNLMSTYSKIGDFNSLMKMFRHSQYNLFKNQRILFHYPLLCLEPVSKKSPSNHYLSDPEFRHKPKVKTNKDLFISYMEKLSKSPIEFQTKNFQKHMGLIEIALFVRPGLEKDIRLQTVFESQNLTQSQRIVNGLDLFLSYTEIIQTVLGQSGYTFSNWLDGALNNKLISDYLNDLKSPKDEQDILNKIIEIGFSSFEDAPSVLKKYVLKKWNNPQKRKAWIDRHGKENALLESFLKMPKFGEKETVFQIGMAFLKEGAIWPEKISSKEWESYLVKEKDEDALADFQKIKLNNILQKTSTVFIPKRI